MVSAAGWPGTPKSGNKIMFTRFESAQRVAVSLVGALLFSALMISVAVPVMPVA